MEPYKLAEGILQIAVTKMASAIKEISVERGYDPRDYVLVPYGGAGPMHAAQIAEELGVSTILVPQFPGNLSALGLIVSDLRLDDVRSWMRTWNGLDRESLEQEFRTLEKDSLASLKREGFDAPEIFLQRSLDLRYKGQAFELMIPLGQDDCPQKVEERFHQRFREAYGHYHPEHPIELVNLRLSSFGRVSKPLLPPCEGGRTSAEQARKEERPAFFQGKFWDTPVYERASLPGEEKLKGPAIIEEKGATTVVPPGWRVGVDAHGNLMVKRGTET